MYKNYVSSLGQVILQLMFGKDHPQTWPCKIRFNLETQDQNFLFFLKILLSERMKSLKRTNANEPLN